MPEFRPTEELCSVLDIVRARVKPNTPVVPRRKAVTEALAEVNDLRLIYGKPCLTEEEMEWIREQLGERPLRIPSWL